MKYYAEFEIPGTVDKFSGVLDLPPNQQPTFQSIEQALADNFDVDAIKLLTWSQLH